MKLLDFIRKKKTDHLKSFALSLAFIMRLKATQKWPIWHVAACGIGKQKGLERV